MFAIPGILALLLFIFVRPLEFLPALRALPMLYICFGVALFGFVIDLKLRRSRPAPTPQLGWVALFYLWCLATLAIRARGVLVPQAIDLAISISLYLLIAHAVQTFRAFQVVAGMLLALTLYLSFVGVHQGLAPFGCISVTYGGGDVTGEYDGRTCTRDRECYDGDPEPGADYICERVGLVGTTSIGNGRVRYLGPLQDPNELALAIGIGLPFALGFLERKRTAPRVLIVVAALGLVAVCTVFTQSRGGQLVFLATLAAYFVKRYGLRGLLAGAVLAAPLFLFGGREGAEAEGSSVERLECWYEGMTMFRFSPIFGVGQGQFIEHHFLTAHNSYVLAPAELGFPGMVAWSIVIYLSTKIPIQALRRYSAPGAGPEAKVAVTWAMALLAAMIGLLVGIFFLSFCYHQILWVYVGMCGAFYSAVKSHDPGFEVGFAQRDFVWVCAIDAGLVGMLFLYTRFKVG
ncbi:MAG: O-antigen ligase domain-containing protein [Myxococcales bacterium]|nr:O-antigen ligase domain-containing protein [Myxococcales bacterium]